MIGIRTIDLICPNCGTAVVTTMYNLLIKGGGTFHCLTCDKYMPMMWVPGLDIDLEVKLLMSEFTLIYLEQEDLYEQTGANAPMLRLEYAFRQILRCYRVLMENNFIKEQGKTLNNNIDGGNNER